MFELTARWLWTCWIDWIYVQPSSVWLNETLWNHFTDSWGYFKSGFGFNSHFSLRALWNSSWSSRSMIPLPHYSTWTWLFWSNVAAKAWWEITLLIIRLTHWSSDYLMPLLAAAAGGLVIILLPWVLAVCVQGFIYALKEADKELISFPGLTEKLFCRGERLWEIFVCLLCVWAAVIER